MGAKTKMETQETGIALMPEHETAIALTGDGVTWYQAMEGFVKQKLEEGVHYGIPKDSRWLKPGLYLGGAQLLEKEARLKVGAWEQIEATIDHETPFYSYRYSCTIIHRETGEVVFTGEGASNSKEKAANDKDPWGNYHNCLAKARKRAYISGIIGALGLSGIFTYDLEDLRPDPEFDKGAAHKYYFGKVINGMFSTEDERHAKQKEVTGKASESDFEKEDYQKMKAWADSERKRSERIGAGEKKRNGAADPEHRNPDPPEDIPNPAATGDEIQQENRVNAMNEYVKQYAEAIDVKPASAAFYLATCLLINPEEPTEICLDRMAAYIKDTLPKLDASKVKGAIHATMIWQEAVTENEAWALIRELVGLPDNVIAKFMENMGARGKTILRYIPANIFPQWRDALSKAKEDCDYQPSPEY